MTTETAELTPSAQEMRDGFVRLEASFEEAAKRCGLHERAIDIAGQTVALRFAGEAMVDQVVPAFAHVARPVPPPGPPALTINVWDSASTGVPLPETRLLPTVDGPAIRPLHHTANLRFVFHAFESTLSFLDSDRGVALHCTSDAASFPPWERACPLKAILNWWSGSLGLHLVHGAAVGRPGGAVLLAGKGGSGKSTTALACLRDGMLYLGDDYVLLEAKPPVVHSIYASAKLDVAQRDRYPELLPEAVSFGSDVQKCSRFLHEVDSARLARWLPLRAVLLPKVTGLRKTHVVPTSRAKAWLALGPPTVFQLPGDGRAALDSIRALLDHVPSFAIELGTDVDAIPAAVSALLATLDGH